MVGGQSNASGIIFYDTDIPENNGVLCYLDQGEEKIITGPHKELMQTLDSMDRVKSEKGHSIWPILLFDILLMTGVIWYVASRIGGFWPVFGAVIFALLGCYPVLSIIYITKFRYGNSADQHLFRTYHGAEHMVMHYASKKNINWSLDEVRKCSRFHGECGSVYLATLLGVGIMLGIFLGKVPVLGFGKALLGIFIGLALFVINIFNPLNPFQIAQIGVVARPTDQQLLLAMKAFRVLKGMDEL